MPEDIYQFKFRISRPLFDRLTRLAARAGFSSANEFAAAALDQYGELLAELIIEQRDALSLIRERQREQLLKKTPAAPETGPRKRK